MLNNLMGVQVVAQGKGYRVVTGNLPPALREALPAGDLLQVSFRSPTPEGFHCLGRNHPEIAEAQSKRLVDAHERFSSLMEKQRFQVVYAHALAAAGGYWQLIYRAAGRFTVRLQAGDDQTVDGIRTWRWE